MTEPPDDLSRATATELRIVLGHLTRRLRTQNQLPLSQATVLARLEREGPLGASDLAARERMRPQSMAQIVKDLAAADFVERRDDPDDRRRILVELTDKGREALMVDRDRRDGWLADVVARELNRKERQTLLDAIVLLQRLAHGSERGRRAP
jgi:DNA-binding MarR family transcriptional regulator